MVYVDEMINRNKKIGSAGPWWCHMIADTLEELHTMADRIGLRRSWFQNETDSPHYDIGTVSKYNLAVSYGAIRCDRRTFTNHLRRIRHNLGR